jgi:hypothetical protein
LRATEICFSGGFFFFWPFQIGTALEANDRAMYQAATTALNMEQQTMLMEIMRIADEAAVAATAAASGGTAIAAGAHRP